jgi:uncharacterized DUF497 family protein
VTENDDPLSNCIGFDWHDGNLDKNWRSHHVPFWECEEIFFNRPLVVRPDSTHFDAEARYFALGQTDGVRMLFVAFTLRKNLIRPISIREMNAREQRHYERAVRKDS